MLKMHQNCCWLYASTEFDFYYMLIKIYTPTILNWLISLFFFTLPHWPVLPAPSLQFNIHNHDDSKINLMFIYVIFHMHKHTCDPYHPKNAIKMDDNFFALHRLPILENSWNIFLPKTFEYLLFYLIFSEIKRQ